MLSIDGEKDGDSSDHRRKIAAICGCSPLFGPKAFATMKDYVAGKQIPPFIKNDDAFFDATNAKKDFGRLLVAQADRAARPKQGGPSGADRHDFSGSGRASRARDARHLKAFCGRGRLDRCLLDDRAWRGARAHGKNGAGKSTLIKVLTGYYRRDAGEIMAGGRAVQMRARRTMRKEGGISTIYQEINLVPLRSVTEKSVSVGKFRRYGLLDWKAMHAEAERLLQGFSIKIDVRRPLGDFNTATQQMVAIARSVGFGTPGDHG